MIDRLIVMIMMQFVELLYFSRLEKANLPEKLSNISLFKSFVGMFCLFCGLTALQGEGYRFPRQIGRLLVAVGHVWVAVDEGAHFTQRHQLW